MSLDIYLEEDDNIIFSSNITHNLGQMAQDAGIYECLWRPDEMGLTKAHQVVAPLRDGLELLKSDPERFKMLNPENGWGSYHFLLRFAEKYLKSCEEHPYADVSVSR